MCPEVLFPMRMFLIATFLNCRSFQCVCSFLNVSDQCRAVLAWLAAVSSVMEVTTANETASLSKFLTDLTEFGNT